MKQLVLFLIVFFCILTSKAQNVGVGTTTPLSKLDLSGDIALREGTAITVAAGVNTIVLPVSKSSVYRLTGASGAFSVSSISAGNDGMLLTLINATGQLLTVTNGSIQTGTGADLVSSSSASTVNLMYNTTLAKWLVVSGEGFVQPSNNIYNSNGTLTGARTVTMAGNAINFTGGNVGIGTASPTSLLANTATNAPGYDGSGVSIGGLTWGTSGNGYVATFFNAGTTAISNGLAIKVNAGGTGRLLDLSVGAAASWSGTGPASTSVMVAQTNGNVGIGTASPSATLHVLGTGNLSAIFESSSTIGTWLDLHNTSTGGQWYHIISTGSANGQGAGKLLFAGGLTAGTTGTIFMTMDNGTGNTGINQASPAYTLDVNGVTNTTTGFKVGGAAAAAGSYLKGDGTNFVSGSIAASDVPTLNQNTTGSAGSFTGSLSGDVTGTQSATTVGKINGVSLGSTTATAGNLLIGSGSQWVSNPMTGDATISSAGVVTLSATPTGNGYIKNQVAADQAAGFRITGNGLFNGGAVGIGTVTPSGKLQVVGDEYVSRILTTGNNVINTGDPKAADIVVGSDAGTRHDGSIMFWSAASADRISNTGDVFYFSNWATTNANAAVSASVGGASYFQGNLSVNTTSSLANLTVNNANTTVAGTPNSYGLGLARSGSNDLTLGSDASFAYMQSWNSKPLLLNGQGNNIGIGLTTAPTAQLHTTGTVRFANYANGILVGDGTGTLTTPRSIAGTVNQLDVTNGNGVAGNPTLNIDPSYTADLKSPANMTGGGNISYISSNFFWSNRFIVISNGNGSQFSTAGYFDITMPTSGTITGVGGAANVTATGSGIPLGGWQAIYYILPVGSNNGSISANFRVAQYTSALVVPETWLLIAVVNGDDGTVRVGNGITLQPGQTWASGSGTGSGWGSSANMMSSRDDINSAGTSNGVAAGVAFTSAMAAGTDESVVGVNIPFTFYINGMACTWVGLSSNGYIQFNTANSFNSAFTNSTLPSGSFSIPTLCYYWDDMVTANGSIRYAIVGAAPNRAMLVDWDLKTFATGAFEIVGQTAIHEGSNLINTTYATVNAYVCGQSATIGMQINANECVPISYNVKVLDDNQSYGAEFVSFSPAK